MTFPPPPPTAAWTTRAAHLTGRSTAGRHETRLEQTYTRTAEPGAYACTAPAFGIVRTLRYDAHGLVLDYPGLAERTL